jgi:hypothetical protein
MVCAGNLKTALMTRTTRRHVCRWHLRWAVTVSRSQRPCCELDMVGSTGGFPCPPALHRHRGRHTSSRRYTTTLFPWARQRFRISKALPSTIPNFYNPDQPVTDLSGSSSAVAPTGFSLDPHFHVANDYVGRRGNRSATQQVHERQRHLSL